MRKVERSLYENGHRIERGYIRVYIYHICSCKRSQKKKIAISYSCGSLHHIWFHETICVNNYLLADTLLTRESADAQKYPTCSERHNGM